MADKEFRDFSHLTDVLGQTTFLKVYTLIALGFSLNDGHNSFQEELERAVKQLVEAFPWIAGHVIRVGSGPGVTGLATVVRYSPGERPTPLLYKDCTELCPPFNEIVSEGAPFSMLEGGVLAVRKGSPDTYEESEEPAPVLVIQANLVLGGVILVFQGNHNIMDMNGMGQLIQLYAKALSDESFSELEIEQGNRDRRNIIKLLSPNDNKVDLSRYIVKAIPKAPQTHPPSSDIRWVYFHFSAYNLAEIKAIAAESAEGVSANNSTGWVSVNDALSAFLCQRITTARLRRLKKVPKSTLR